MYYINGTENTELNALAIIVDIKADEYIGKELIIQGRTVNTIEPITIIVNNIKGRYSRLKGDYITADIYSVREVVDNNNHMTISIDEKKYAITEEISDRLSSVNVIGITTIPEGLQVIIN